MIDYNDLVGVPYLWTGRNPVVGLDCLGAILELFRRKGIALADPGSVALAGAEDPREVLAVWPEQWTPAPWPLRELDVVVFRPPDNDLPLHVGAVVQQCPPAIFQVSKKLGGSVLRLELLRRHMLGVYRHRELAA